VAWVTSLRHSGYWNIAAGIVGGLLAAVFGLIDWLAIPAGTRAKRIGLLHGGSNVGVVLIFALAWLMRGNTPGAVPTTTLFLLEVVGLALGSVAGWLGGELVDRLGVGRRSARVSCRGTGSQRNS
jgi:uncharacterized membrane protein